MDGMPTFQLEDVVGHPEFQGLSLADKNEFLLKHVPEFSGYNPKARSEFLDTVHYGAAPKPEEAPSIWKPAEPLTASSVWAAATKPIGSDVAEATRSWISSAAGRHLPPRIAPPVAYGATLATAIPASMVEFGRRMVNPLTLMTAGAGGGLSALRAAPAVPATVRAGLGAVETAGGGAFGLQGLKQAVEPAPPGETGLQQFERRVGGVGQGLLGGLAAGQGLKEGFGKATERMRGAMAERLAQSLLGPEAKGTPSVSRPAPAVVAEGPVAATQKGLTTKIGKTIGEHEATVQATLAASKGAAPEPLEPIVMKAVKPLMDEARALGHPEITERIQTWARRFLSEHPKEVSLEQLHNLRKMMGSNQPLFKGTSEEFSDLKTAKKEVYRGMNEVLDRRMPGIRDVTERQSGLIQARQMLKEQARREAGGPILPTPRLYGGVSGGGGDFAAARIGMPMPFETLLKTGAIKLLGKRLPLAEPMPAAVAPPRLGVAPLGPPEPGAVTPPQAGGMSIERLKTLSDRLAAERMAAEGAVPGPVSPLGRRTLAGFPMQYHRAATAEATAPVPLGKTPALHAESAELATVKGIKSLVSSGQANKLTPEHLTWLGQHDVNINEPGAVAAALKAANSRLNELTGTAKGKPAPVARGSAPNPWGGTPRIAAPAVGMPVGEAPAPRPAIAAPPEAPRIALEALKPLAVSGKLPEVEKGATIGLSEVPRGVQAYQGPIGVRQTLSEPTRPTSPVVGGARTTIAVPGEARTYQARYEVRELDDVHASHSGETFAENPNYRLRNERDYLNPVNQGKVLEWSTPDKFEARYHVTNNPDASNGPTIIDQDGNALGGNARAMILERVYRYNKAGAEAYKQSLQQNAAQFGIDPKAVAEMKRPVLVRVADDASIEGPAAKRTAIADFNKKPTAELTPSERAISDSKRVSQETLDDISARLADQGETATLAQVLSGDSGKQVIVNLVRDGVVSPQEYAGMAGKMGLTDAAKERVGKLLIGRFFEDAAQMDNTPPFVKAKLERISAPAAKTSAIPEWSLDADIRQALDLVGQLQAHGLENVSDLLRQGGMFGPTGNYSPRAVALAEALQTQGTKALTEAMRRYAQDAVDSQRPMVSMFGQKVSPDQAFQEAFGGRK